MPLPVEIIGLGKAEVRIVWDEGHEGAYAARDLRLRCGCAYCKEEMSGRPLLDPASVPADVTVTEMELIGGYGLRVSFSDGHSTGIYRFAELFDACPCDICTARREAGGP